MSDITFILASVNQPSRDIKTMDNQINDAEYNARLWAKSHPEFIRPGADILKVKKVKPMDERTAQVIRDELNATRRYICSYCKKEFIYKAVFKRHQTKCIADTVSKPLSKPTATLTQPAVSEDLLKAIVEDTAKPYEPKAATATVNSGYIKATVTPQQPTYSRKAQIVTYLIMAILSAVALCLMVAAALGIKMLVGL